MKLLQKFEDKEEAKLFASKLLQKGIAVHLAGTYSSNYRVITGTTSIGVWIVFNEQLEDAIKLLNDPEYLVKNRLPDEEIEKFHQALEGQPLLLKINDGTKYKILIGIIFFMVLVFISFMVLK